jgi:hypothetical protein
MKKMSFTETLQVIHQAQTSGCHPMVAYDLASPGFEPPPGKEDGGPHGTTDIFLLTLE